MGDRSRDSQLGCWRDSCAAITEGPQVRARRQSAGTSLRRSQDASFRSTLDSRDRDGRIDRRHDCVGSGGARPRPSERAAESRRSTRVLCLLPIAVSRAASTDVLCAEGALPRWPLVQEVRRPSAFKGAARFCHLHLVQPRCVPGAPLVTAIVERWESQAFRREPLWPCAPASGDPDWT